MLVHGKEQPKGVNAPHQTAVPDLPPGIRGTVAAPPADGLGALSSPQTLTLGAIQLLSDISH